MFRNLALYAALAISTYTPAKAETYAVFNNFSAGYSNFSDVVEGAGKTVTNFSLPENTDGSYSDFTITRPTGGNVFVSSPYELSGSSPVTFTSGGVVDISPTGSTSGIGARDSGVTFNFVNPINALGFQVGDWATCCQPSNLYLQFGSSTPILLGKSIEYADQFLTNGGAGVFVGAFDNSDTFSSVTFWGDGFGEYLVAGGTISYANIGAGTPLPGPGAVPEPASWAMLLLGFGAVGSIMRTSRRSHRLTRLA